MIFKGMSQAKAVAFILTDAEKRKQRDQTGLDTLVVFAVKDECLNQKIFDMIVNTKHSA